MKGFALRLVLKQRHARTRKWPILQISPDPHSVVIPQFKARPAQSLPVVVVFRLRQFLRTKGDNGNLYLSDVWQADPKCMMRSERTPAAMALAVACGVKCAYS